MGPSAKSSAATWISPGPTTMAEETPCVSERPILARNSFKVL